MLMRMGRNHQPEVSEEELNFYGYETCEDYYHTYCVDYWKCRLAKCAFYKAHEIRENKKEVDK